MKCGVAHNKDGSLFVIINRHMCLRDNIQFLKKGLKPYFSPKQFLGSKVNKPSKFLIKTLTVEKSIDSDIQNIELLDNMLH